MDRDRAKLTLDQVIEAFERTTGPWRRIKRSSGWVRCNELTAADLLMAATTYWSDEMISDEEYGAIVTMVADDLRQSDW